MRANAGSEQLGPVVCPFYRKLCRVASDNLKNNYLFTEPNAGPFWPFLWYCPQCASSTTEYSGCFSLIFCENGIPISSPRHQRGPSTSLCALHRLSRARRGGHSCGGFLRCQESESLCRNRRRCCKRRFSTGAPPWSQCRLKSSLFNFASGQSRHC